MFNKSRLQDYAQRYLVTGAKLTHTLTPKLFYSLDFQFSYSDHEVTPFGLDTTQANAWTYVDSFRVLNVPQSGFAERVDQLADGYQ
jgi:hypothetical protein